MKHNTAGAVLFDPEIQKVCLIYKLERKEWLLPKGHINEGETQIDAAKREVYEETGYKNFIMIDSTPVAINKFTFGDNEEKTIYIFACILLSKDRKETKEREEEGLVHEWFTVKEAIEKASHKDIKDSILKAYGQIKSLKSNNK